MRKASTQRVHWALCLLLCGYFWAMLGLSTAVAQSVLDETTLSNVDTQVTTSFFGLRYNRSTQTYVGFVTITNTSTTPLPTPLYLVVTAVTPGSVSVVKAKGMTLQQHPYYNLSKLIPGTTLGPKKTTARLTLEFRNPTNVALQVTASVFIPRPSAPPNRPPMLAAIGNRTVREGELLQFTVTASDPDGNQVTLSSSALPPNASFDQATGVLMFQPDFTQGGMTIPMTFTALAGVYGRERARGIELL